MEWSYTEQAGAARGLGAGSAFLLLLIGLGMIAPPWNLFASAPAGWWAFADTTIPEEMWGLPFLVVGLLHLIAQRKQDGWHLQARRYLLPLNFLCFAVLEAQAFISNRDGLAPWFYLAPLLLDIWSASFLYSSRAK